MTCQVFRTSKVCMVYYRAKILTSLENSLKNVSLISSWYQLARYLWHGLGMGGNYLIGAAGYSWAPIGLYNGCFFYDFIKNLKIIWKCLNLSKLLSTLVFYVLGPSTQKWADFSSSIEFWIWLAKRRNSSKLARIQKKTHKENLKSGVSAIRVTRDQPDRPLLTLTSKFMPNLTYRMKH